MNQIPVPSEHAIRLASKAELVDLRDLEHKDSITMSFLGNRGELTALRNVAVNAFERRGISVLTDLDRTNANYGKDKYYLTLTFPKSQGDLTCSELLYLVHNASRCDIGARVSAHTDHYDITRKRTGEINTRFVPEVHIHITHDDIETQNHIAHYLRHRLKAYFDYQSQHAMSGEVGLPVQYHEEEGLHGSDSNQITLSFLKKETTHGYAAKRSAQVLAEHFSGILGIAERVSCHQPSGAIPNN